MTNIPETLPEYISIWVGYILVFSGGIAFSIGLIIAYLALRNIKKSAIFSFLATLMIYLILPRSLYLIILSDVFGKMMDYQVIPNSGYNFGFLITYSISGIASGILGILLASGYTKLILYLERKGKWTKTSHKAVRIFSIAVSLVVTAATLIWFMSTAWMKILHQSWDLFNFDTPMPITIAVISGILLTAVYTLKVELRECTDTQKKYVIVLLFLMIAILYAIAWYLTRPYFAQFLR